MPAFLIDAVTGAIASSSDFNSNNSALEAAFDDLSPVIVSGLAISAGAGLAVAVATGDAYIGKDVAVTVGFSIAGLVDATTNHIYLLYGGTGTSNTTGTQPADSVKLGTAITAGGVVTSVQQNWASGRQTQRRTDVLVHGSGAGHPRAVDLASWHATNSEGNEVKGLLPGGAFGAIALDNLTDVNVPTVAQGDILYRNATEWVRLVAGTSGQFLKTLGSGANPIWDTGGAGATTLDGLSDVNLPTPAHGDILIRNSVEWVKLAAGTSGQFLKTLGAANSPAWDTLALDTLSDVNLVTASQGDLLYRNATEWVRLGAGTAGQVLTTGGAAANPSWTAASATTLDGLTDVNLPAASQGDILYRNATEWVRLVAGTAGQALTTGGAAANPSWSNVSTTPAVATKTGNYTLLTTDDVILGDATTASFTLTLPAVAGNTGLVFQIKKINANANTVTVDANAAELIDGGLTAVLSVQYSSIDLVCDGTAWYIL